MSDPKAQRDALAAIPGKYATPAPEKVCFLPRITCPDCRNAQGKVCGKHRKEKCQGCGNFITTQHIHLSYEGHAEITLDLCEIDPLWSWEPMGYAEDGTPTVIVHERSLSLWGWLTVHGKRLPCVGTAPKKEDADKELIGDLLRNGALRFGIGTNLWSKAEAGQRDEEPEESPPRAASGTKAKPPSSATSSTRSSQGGGQEREEWIRSIGDCKTAHDLNKVNGMIVKADAGDAVLWSAITGHAEAIGCRWSGERFEVVPADDEGVPY